MTDILMCTSKECPKRKECYRSTAKPSDWQLWDDFYDKESLQVCEHFWGATYEEALVEMGYTLR